MNRAGLPAAVVVLQVRPLRPALQSTAASIHSLNPDHPMSHAVKPVLVLSMERRPRAKRPRNPSPPISTELPATSSRLAAQNAALSTR